MRKHDFRLSAKYLVQNQGAEETEKGEAESACISRELRPEGIEQIAHRGKLPWSFTASFRGGCNASIG